MEFEDVIKRVEWEARRVAAAFGVAECPPVPLPLDVHHHFEGYAGEDWIQWNVHDGHPRDILVNVGLRGSECECSRFYCSRAIGPSCSPHPHYNAQMVRGLYRLGIEDEDIVTQFNYTLSAHEKLELRLSLPREFWPQKWFDEEETKDPRNSQVVARELPE